MQPEVLGRDAQAWKCRQPGRSGGGGGGQTWSMAPLLPSLSSLPSSLPSLSSSLPVQSSSEHILYDQDILQTLSTGGEH